MNLPRAFVQSMKYNTVEGVNNPVSRIVLGSMSIDIDRLAYSVALLDYFFERGGNCIDTAWIYRQGNSEKGVAAWIEHRGIRDKIVLIGKGAAPVQSCTPAVVTEQLIESLARLRTDYVDIYLMHRDNPKIPVGEFVECLNEHWHAGRIRSFGGSNWAVERLEQANEQPKFLFGCMLPTCFASRRTSSHWSALKTLRSPAKGTPAMI